MSIYVCSNCQEHTAGRRGPGFWIWLVISLLFTPFMLGFLMLLLLLCFSKYCTYCGAPL